MNKVLGEGLDLAQQLAALPFKAARQLLEGSTLKNRAVGDVLSESLSLSEGFARLPFKAAAALLTELGEQKPNLEERVATLEQKAREPGAGPGT